MKIFVFSDTHENAEGINLVLSKSKPDLFIHLGDCVKDALEIQYKYPSIELIYIRGNCDEDQSIPDEKHICIAGKRFYLTHGDRFNHGKGATRSEPESEIAAYAIQNDVDIILYGHTHIPVLSLERGLFIMNPGSASLNKKWNYCPTFGEIELYENNTVCKILSVEMFHGLAPASDS